MSRRTLADDAADLDAALSELLQAWLGVAELVAAWIEYAAGVMLDALRAAGRILDAAAHYAGRQLTAGAHTAGQLDPIRRDPAAAGAAPAGGELPAGYADVVVLDVTADMSKFDAIVAGVARPAVYRGPAFALPPDLAAWAAALRSCPDGCRHRCPACRAGLVSHLSCDPQCELLTSDMA